MLTFMSYKLCVIYCWVCNIIYVYIFVNSTKEAHDSIIVLSSGNDYK